MSGFHFVFEGDTPTLFNDRFMAIRDRIAQAMSLSVAETVAAIETKGRADISGAGRFGARWTTAFTARCTPDPGQPSDQYTIEVYFQGIPYGHVFEYGATIQPKGGGSGGLFGGGGLLWIPLSFAGVPQSGGGEGLMTAQEYGASVNKLFRVDRKAGAPLLLDIKTRKPMYFGIPTVTLKPRFHIRDVCAQVMGDFQTLLDSKIKES